MLTTPIIPTDRNGQNIPTDVPKTKYTVDQLAMALAGVVVELRNLKAELAELQEEMAELGVAQ